MKSRRALLFANGNLDSGCLSDLRKTDLVIGVDRAAYWLIEHGVVPDVAIGDFDSVSKAELARIRAESRKFLPYPSQKDETDLDLAVGYAVGILTSHIIIYGGTGTRLDHQTAALAILEKHASAGILLRDGHNEVFLLHRNVSVSKDPAYTYLSVLPVSRSVTVSLSGVKYPACRKRIRRGSTLGISNEITAGRAHIEVHAGTALIVRSRD